MIAVTKLWAPGLSMAFASAQAACFDGHVDPIVEVHLATSVEGATEGPWAACVAPGGEEQLDLLVAVRRERHVPGWNAVLARDPRTRPHGRAGRLHVEVRM
ncbi:hypothetical protein [Sorangium sp. So ce1078]|uniref:hypothetical protein n=1 Tax=Sorangium sp. So ce1078 TaxID=3133329 RepID=UPI003F5F82CA